MFAYPKTDPMAVLLVLLGLQPFRDRHLPASSWLKKIQLIGIPMCIYNLAMNVYTYRIELQRYDVLRSLDNIINATATVKRSLAIFVPWTYTAFRIIQDGDAMRFGDKMLKFDEQFQSMQRLLRGLRMSPQTMTLKTRKWNWLAAFWIVAAETINLIFSYYFILLTSPQTPDPLTLYLFHTNMLVFSVMTVYVALRTYDVFLRCDMFLHIAKHIQMEIERDSLDKWLVTRKYKRSPGWVKGTSGVGAKGALI